MALKNILHALKNAQKIASKPGIFFFTNLDVYHYEN
jgi:hypothetical protein